MNVILLDVSYNSSSKMIHSAIKRHMDVDMVYAFDCRLYRYQSTRDFLIDLNDNPEDYFTNPAAFYDNVITVCSKIRKQNRKTTITIISAMDDNCSILADEDSYHNYIHHLKRFYPIEISTKLTESMFYSTSNDRSKGFLQRLAEWRIINTGEAYVDDY